MDGNKNKDRRRGKGGVREGKRGRKGRMENGGRGRMKGGKR